MSQKRHFRGSPVGGRFAPSPRAEAVGVELDEEIPAQEAAGPEQYADEFEERAARHREERASRAETNAVLMEIAGARRGTRLPQSEQAPSAGTTVSGSFADEYEERAARHRQRRGEAEDTNAVLMDLAAQRRARQR